MWLLICTQPASGGVLLASSSLLRLARARGRGGLPSRGGLGGRQDVGGLPC